MAERKGGSGVAGRLLVALAILLPTGAARDPRPERAAVTRRPTTPPLEHTLVAGAVYLVAAVFIGDLVDLADLDIRKQNLFIVWQLLLVLQLAMWGVALAFFHTWSRQLDRWMPSPVDEHSRRYLGNVWGVALGAMLVTAGVFFLLPWWPGRKGTDLAARTVSYWDVAPELDGSMWRLGTIALLNIAMVTVGLGALRRTTVIAREGGRYDGFTIDWETGDPRTFRAAIDLFRALSHRLRAILAVFGVLLSLYVVSLGLLVDVSNDAAKADATVTVAELSVDTLTVEIEADGVDLVVAQPDIVEVRKRAATVSEERTIFFGVLLAGILALLYIPAHLFLERSGSDLTRRIAAANAADLDGNMKLRQSVRKELGLGESASTVVEGATVIFGPLVTALITTFVTS